MQLNKTEYSVGYDNLISSSKHPSDVTVIEVEANQGVLKRGTVISHVHTDAVEESETQEAIPEFYGYRVLSGTCSDAKYIVSDDVDTESTDTLVPVTVYKSGNFRGEALIASSDYLISKADFEKLRDVGIFVD